MCAVDARARVGPDLSVIRETGAVAQGSSTERGESIAASAADGRLDRWCRKGVESRLKRDSDH